jgi:rubrerythrin
MIIEIPDDNSIVKWKMNDKDDWKSAEISDLINAYEERPQSEWVRREELFDDEETPRMVWGCKECGFSLKSSHDKQGYCPNCGRQMIR